MNNNILNFNNIKLVGSKPKNNNPKSKKGSPPMNKKPTPFVLGFGRNKSQQIENTTQFRENQLQNITPLNNRPFKNDYIKFNNNIHKNYIKKNYENKKVTYSAYLKKDPIDDNSFDLHKANWDVSKRNRPTEKLRSIKLGDPFKVGNKHKTNFGYVYSAGGIPCRIEHGAVSMKLVWNIPPESLDYDPILITCFEGLLETVHPYSFVAKQCIRELLLAKNADKKVLPLLSRIINPLKNALRCNLPEIFCEAMNDLELISDLVKEDLNKYLHFFLLDINKRSFQMHYKERVFEVLRTLEQNGGIEASKEIKKRIPTYTALI